MFCCCYIEEKTFNSVDANNPYFHKVFAITGKFEISRNELVKLIEQKYLGTVVSNITKSTNYLVLGKDPSSKLQTTDWFDFLMADPSPEPSHSCR